MLPIPLSEDPSFTKTHDPFPFSRLHKRIKPNTRQIYRFRNKTSFDGEELLAPRPTSKLEDHPLSAARDCLLNLFAATLLIGGRFSNRKWRKRHAVVTGIQ